MIHFFLLYGQYELHIANHVCFNILVITFKYKSIMSTLLKSNYLFIYCFFLIVSLGAIYSCNKNDDNLIVEPSQPTSIIIGDSLNLYFKKYENEKLVFFQPRQACYIDIDDNGVNDVMFESEISMAMGTGFRYNIGCVCLNDSIEICSVDNIDSIYVFIDTVFNDSGKDGVYARIQKWYSCSKENLDYNAVSAHEREYVRRFKLQDTLFFSNFFSNSEFVLRNNGYTQPPTIQYTRNDTSYYLKEYRVYFCHMFPRDGDAYLGLKITKNQKNYLGWIKISIIDGYEVTIHESAVQLPLD